MQQYLIRHLLNRRHYRLASDGEDLGFDACCIEVVVAGHPQLVLVLLQVRPALDHLLDCQGLLLLIEGTLEGHVRLPQLEQIFLVLREKLIFRDRDVGGHGGLLFRWDCIVRGGLGPAMGTIGLAHNLL